MNSQLNKAGSWALKFCVLGDGGVGKTTLVERLATGNFNPITKMTIGIDFSLIHMNVMLDGANESTPVDVTVWDLGGEDRFRFMLPSYIQGADGGIILYDVNRFTSAMSLPTWMKIWRENVAQDTPIYLVGSKFDLVKPSMYNMIENNIQTLKQELGLKVHFLISTKNGIMIDDLMYTVIKEMITFKTRGKPAQPTYSFENTLRA
ncbi:MAG: Rab family GTPase [Promethearchaeota archaeon]